MIAGFSLELIRTVAIIIQALAIIAATGGVFLTWKQVRLTKEQVELRKDQSTTEFENELAQEYRKISREIPVKAFLGDELSECEEQKYFREFYSYIDLSNEQVFLRHEGRVSSETWENWAEGIESNLQKNAFQNAWNEIKERSEGSFSELRRLENEGFDSDPQKWDEI